MTDAEIRGIELEGLTKVYPGRTGPDGASRPSVDDIGLTVAHGLDVTQRPNVPPAVLVGGPGSLDTRGEV